MGERCLPSCYGGRMKVKLLLSSLPWVWNVLNPNVILSLKLYWKFPSLVKRRPLTSMNQMGRSICTFPGSCFFSKMDIGMCDDDTYLNEILNYTFTVFSGRKTLESRVLVITERFCCSGPTSWLKWSIKKDFMFLDEEMGYSKK